MNDLRRLQLAKLEMLHKFAEVCSAYGLSWFADGGTLLGAVRHGGFIPWDDDIDVCMPRADHDRLPEFASDFHEPLFLQHCRTDVRACRGHVQLRRSDTTEFLEVEMQADAPVHRFNQGLFIDVFPLDNAPEPRSSARFGRRLARLKGAMWDSRSADEPKCFDCQRRFDEFVSSLPPRGIVDTMAVNFRPEQFTPAACYERRAMLKFEDMELPAPADFERRLERLYGADWRTPKRTPPFHGGTFVDLDRPYTEYF